MQRISHLLQPTAVALAALLVAGSAGAQVPDARIGGKIDGQHTIPPIMIAGSVAANGNYTFGSRTMQLSLEADAAISGTSACVFETLPDGTPGPFIDGVNRIGPGSFFDTITLTVLQEIQLFNRGLYVEVAGTSVVGGKIRAQASRERRGIRTRTSGESSEVHTMQFDPDEALTVKVDSENGGLLGGTVMAGTPSQPGAVLGNLPPSIGESSQCTIPLEELDAATVFQGAPLFVRLDYGSESIDVPLESGIGDTLAFPNGQESGTGSQSFGKFHFDELADGSIWYDGDLYDTSATGAELRMGGFGQSGTTIATLTHQPGGTRFSGTLNLNPTQRTALSNGNTFVIIFTAAFPAGELRGQVLFPPFLATMFSRGCPDVNGEQNYMTTTDSFVGVGRDSTISVTGTNPGAAVWFMFSFQGETLPPWNLTTLGLTNCLLQFDPASVIRATANTNGTASLTLRVPSSLFAFIVVSQAAVHSPGANQFDTILTNGLRLPVN